MKQVRSHQAPHKTIVPMDQIWNTDTQWQLELERVTTVSRHSRDLSPLQSNAQQEMSPSHQSRGQTQCTAWNHVLLWNSHACKRSTRENYYRLLVAFKDSHGEAEKQRALQPECGPFVSRTRAGVIPPAGVLSHPNERSFQTCESARRDM